VREALDWLLDAARPVVQQRFEPSAGPSPGPGPNLT
jgi:hypothetical protein